MAETMPVTPHKKLSPTLKKVDPGPYFKFFPKRWLQGSLRWQNTPEERSFWIDLLSMAATSTYPGVIASSKEGQHFIGQPVGWIAGQLLHDCSFVIETLEKFEQQKRIKIEVQDNEPDQVSVIRIVNWKRYQSEYQRQKPYRDAKREEARLNPELPGLKTRYKPGEDPDKYIRGERGHLVRRK